MTEALRSLHDDPEMHEVETTTRQEIALNGTYLRDVILSDFDAYSPRAALEMTDVNANTTDEPVWPISSPGFFANRMDIMDWALRYNRDKPIKNIGDPKISLNNSQIRAIGHMISERISVVQGVSTSLPIFGFPFYSCRIDSSLQEPERRGQSSKLSGYSRNTSKCITRSWCAHIPTPL